jgi:hypothetical protein
LGTVRPALVGRGPVPFSSATGTGSIHADVARSPPVLLRLKVGCAGGGGSGLTPGAAGAGAGALPRCDGRCSAPYSARLPERALPLSLALSLR